MNQLSYYVTKRLIVGSKDSSGTIIQKEKETKAEEWIRIRMISEAGWFDVMADGWIN